MRNTLRGLLVNILLLLTVILIFIFFLEGILKLFFPALENQLHCKIYQEDETFVYTLKPNLSIQNQNHEYYQYVKTNSLGMRENKEIGEKKGYRILAVGDSMMFGWGVNAEDSFIKILEKRLNEYYNQPIEIINTGVPGYNTIQEKRVIEKYKEQFNPDLILLSVYPNDFEENEYVYWVVKDGCMFGSNFASKNHSLLMKFRIYLKGHSQVYNLFFNRVLRIDFIKKIFYKLGLISPTKIKIADTYLKNLSSFDNKSISLFNEIIDMSPKLLVLYIPSKLEVNEKYLNNILNEGGINETLYDISKIQNLLNDLILNKYDHVSFVDSTEALRKSNSSFFIEDPHINKEGNQIVAEELYDFIINHNYIIN